MGSCVVKTGKKYEVTNITRE